MAANNFNARSRLEQIWTNSIPARCYSVIGAIPWLFIGTRLNASQKLSGTIDKASKSIEVKETERTKTNVPVTIRNCFQIHRLTYLQQGDEQSLEGTWVPVPSQQGDCGFGTTILTRRTLKKNSAYLNNPVTKTKPVVKPPTEAQKIKNIAESRRFKAHMHMAVLQDNFCDSQIKSGKYNLNLIH